MESKEDSMESKEDKYNEIMQEKVVRETLEKFLPKNPKITNSKCPFCGESITIIYMEDHNKFVVGPSGDLKEHVVEIPLAPLGILKKETVEIPLESLAILKKEDIGPEVKGAKEG